MKYDLSRFDKQPTPTRAVDVLQRLADRAETYKYNGRCLSFDSKSSQEHYRDSKDVGQLVLRSSPEDRALLETITSDDIASVKYPSYDYVKQIYNEKAKTWSVDTDWRPSRKRSIMVSFSEIKT